eukprot:scaffold131_cov381-Pinguiococcus_pyrenoidosus.AAC.1
MAEHGTGQWSSPEGDGTVACHFCESTTICDWMLVLGVSLFIVPSAPGFQTCFNHMEKLEQQYCMAFHLGRDLGTLRPHPLQILTASATSGFTPTSEDEEDCNTDFVLALLALHAPAA